MHSAEKAYGRVVLVGFKPDLGDELVTFSALSLSVGSFACKNRLRMTCDVSSVTLSLKTITAVEHSYETAEQTSSDRKRECL